LCNADFNDVVHGTHCARRKNAHHTMIRYLLCFDKQYKETNVRSGRVTHTKALLSCYSPPKAEGYRFGVVRPAVRLSGRHKLVGAISQRLWQIWTWNLGVYRSHRGKVHYTRTITIHLLILELSPLVVFILPGRHTLVGAISQSLEQIWT